MTTQNDNPQDQPYDVQNSNLGYRLTGRGKLVAVIVWWILFVISLFYFITSTIALARWDITPVYHLPLYFGPIDAASIQYLTDYQKVMAEIGLTLPAYAIYFAVLRVIAGIVCFGLSYLMLRRNRDQLVPMLIAMFLLVAAACGRWYSPNWNWSPTLFITSNISFADFINYPIYLLILLKNLGLILLFIYPDGRFKPRWTRWAAGLIILNAILSILPVNTMINPNNWSHSLSLLRLLLLAGIVLAAVIQRYAGYTSPEQKPQVKRFVTGVIVILIVYIVCVSYYDVIEKLGITAAFINAIHYTGANASALVSLFSEMIVEPVWYIGQAVFAILIGQSILRSRMTDPKFQTANASPSKAGE